MFNEARRGATRAIDEAVSEASRKAVREGIDTAKQQAKDAITSNKGKLIGGGAAAVGTKIVYDEQRDRRQAKRIGEEVKKVAALEEPTGYNMQHTGKDISEDELRELAFRMHADKYIIPYMQEHGAYPQGWEHLQDPKAAPREWTTTNLGPAGEGWGGYSVDLVPQRPIKVAALGPKDIPNILRNSWAKYKYDLSGDALPPLQNLKQQLESGYWGSLDDKYNQEALRGVMEEIAKAKSATRNTRIGTGVAGVAALGAGAAGINAGMKQLEPKVAALEESDAEDVAEGVGILAEIKKTLKKKTAAQAPGTAANVAAGLDPFGVWSSGLGQQAERAGVSGGEHGRNLAANVAGGVVGSGLGIPAAIMGTVGGAKALGRSSGSLKSRLAQGARGFGEGAVKPFKTLADVGRVGKFVHGAGKAQDATEIPKEILQAAGRLGGETPVGEIVDRAAKTWGATREFAGEVTPFLSALKDGKYMEAAMNLERAANAVAGKDPDLAMEMFEQAAALKNAKAPVMTPEVARRIKGQGAKEMATGALMPMIMGGTVGGAGAGVQYSKGRGAEQEFAKRTASIKDLARSRRTKQAWAKRSKLGFSKAAYGSGGSTISGPENARMLELWEAASGNQKREGDTAYFLDQLPEQLQPNIQYSWDPDSDWRGRGTWGASFKMPLSEAEKLEALREHIDYAEHLPFHPDRPE
jgi:hypothetical protein